MGQFDTRAEAFLSVARIVISLIKVGDLAACVLENVVGICQKIPGLQQSFMDQLLDILNQEAGEFDWAVVTLAANDYLLAQTRKRVFLRGVRKAMFPRGVPDPLPPFGQRTWHDFLCADLPCVERSSLTEVMAKNLQDAEKILQQSLQNGEYAPTDLSVFPLDRADGKKYQRRYTQNACPTLTTNNSYLFVASLDFKKSDQDRKFFRFLGPSERMNLQGFAGATLKEASDALRVKASGNAYPVPLMIPDLEAAATSNHQ